MKIPLRHFRDPAAADVSPLQSPGRQSGLTSAPSVPSRAVQSAFTMVEIALSLAIIGFALVAVIGVLPTGLRVQRDNREETIINQEANVWMGAICNGARGYDDFTNCVSAITNFWTVFNPNGTVFRQGRDGFDQTSSDIQSVSPAPRLPLTNGYIIVGLLSTPKYEYRNLNEAAQKIIGRSNYVVAYVQAMSGAATEKFPQDNANVRELAFRYRMICEIVPRTQWDTNWIAYNPSLPSWEDVAHSNYWAVSRQLYTNLHDVRLTFRWPLLPRGVTGNGRQVFRSTAGGMLTRTNVPPAGPWYPLYFIDGRAYTLNPEA